MLLITFAPIDKVYDRDAGIATLLTVYAIDFWNHHHINVSLSLFQIKM